MNRTGVIYGINGPVIYLQGNTGFKMSEMDISPAAKAWIKSRMTSQMQTKGSIDKMVLIPERTHPKTVKTWNFPAYPNILDSSPFFCFSISKSPFAIIDGLAFYNPSIIIKSFGCFCHSMQSVSIQSDT